MASQPSVDNEERNLLRLRAWERRNQETRQTKEFNLENEPLFGQPYKTNKGDELSNRIKKMLGSYEVGNNSCPFSIVPFNIPTSVTMSQSYQHQPSTDQSAKPQIHNLVSTENCGPSANSLTSQYARTSTASSPDGREHGKRRRNNLSDPGEPFSPDQEMSAQSPDIKPPPIFHSSVHNNAETFDRQQLPRSDGPSSECLNTMDVSTLNLKQSPKDTPVSQVNMNNTLHSQNFAPLLSSKQPHVIPTQKPTAYVRPNLPELISESDLVKRKTKPPCLEIRRDDQFVEDILKEMTSLWPPLLTTIHTPSTEECPKILFPAKEAEGVSSCPVLKHPEPSPSDSAHLNKRFPPKSCGPTHSSGGESESECDSLAEEPVVPSVKTEPDASVLSHGNRHLGNWIRPSQQSSSSEVQADAHVPESDAHKEVLPTQSPRLFHGEASSPLESKPEVSFHQEEFTDKHSAPKKPLKESERQDECSREKDVKPLPADVTASSSHRQVSKHSKADQTDSALSVQSEVVPSTQTCLAEVKAKTRHGKRSKDRSDSKRDTKRTKHKSADKQNVAVEPGPQVPPTLPSIGPPCSVHFPNVCSCPTQSPAQPKHPKIRDKSKKHKEETVSETASKTPHQDVQKKSKKPKHVTKDSLDLHHPPKSLLVKLDLRLLLKDHKSSSSLPGIPSKGSTLVREQDTQVHMGSKKDKRSTKDKAQKHDVETKAQPRKKQKLNNNTSLSSLTSVKLGTSRHVADAQGKKHPKKPSLQFDACKEKPKDSKLKKSCLEKKQGSNKELVKSKESSKHKECSRKIPEQPHTDKPKAPKRRVALASTSTSQPRRKVQSHRPLLSFDERKCPVKHYIKEAKRLKHQADAESDKLSKAYNYLDAAMFFVESGIAMEKDPQISKSSYTMFAETVELLRFVLKLKHSDESLSPPAEKDFLALCLKCLSLLQMAMFRHKYPTALKYSKVLTEHFDEVRNSSNSTSRVSDLSSPNVPSPSSTSVTGTSSVAPPQTMNQVSLTYVNITTLVLNAHEVWDQMEELEHRGSGLLAELDALMGPLTLSSSMSSMVRYTRQGVHWLRHDTKKL
ncbi:AF4/FMR2 family member 4 isoform X1 [Gouania willdenowi]|uniref:AF4/FMR2 family member lilli n=1 Tax=Gouania willdenowi TaxID=441366 RepID=A0A8C5ECT4_GOUWI|nr:AF4/FMR2 family member 4-like isoform X1 [Gouania willdenowi]XP_028318803.1 AF4/FMR2 family member 4-like isoform X1 [Gouania willdenowi]